GGSEVASSAGGAAGVVAAGAGATAAGAADGASGSGLAGAGGACAISGMGAPTSARVGWADARSSSAAVNAAARPWRGSFREPRIGNDPLDAGLRRGDIPDHQEGDAADREHDQQGDSTQSDLQHLFPLFP